MNHKGNDTLVKPRKQLDTSDNDWSRAVVRDFPEELNPAGANAARNSDYQGVPNERADSRNGKSLVWSGEEFITTVGLRGRGLSIGSDHVSLEVDWTCTCLVQ